MLSVQWPSSPRLATSWGELTHYKLFTLYDIMKIHEQEDCGFQTYRIIQEGGIFQAQIRTLFFWWRNLEKPRHSLAEAEKDINNHQLSVAAGAYT
jgi:hypothetical protein